MRRLPLCFAPALFCLPTLAGEEITSNVIHNYSYIAVHYAYLQNLPDYGGEVRLHGFGAEGSYEFHNIVASVQSSQFFGTDSRRFSDVDSRVWDIAGGIGYIFRFDQNHLNIVPRLAARYREITQTYQFFGTFTDDFTSIHPGITLSYALNNRVSLYNGYSFVHEFDTGDDVHVVHAGGRLALSDRFGLNLEFSFDDDVGFLGGTIGLSYHF